MSMSFRSLDESGATSRMLERRRSPRIQILGRLHGQIVGLDIPVTVRDISLNGLMIETPLSFPIGAVHLFRLVLGDDSVSVMTARIVRSRETVASDGSRLFVSGAEFIDVEPEQDAVSILDILEKLDP